MFKVYLAPGESGWARRVTADVALIDNMPMSGDLHYGDLVLLNEDESAGIRTVKEVLVRQYPNKAHVTYQTRGEFMRFVSVCNMLHARVENYMPAGENKPGVCSVAYDETVFDPFKLAESLGINPYALDEDDE